MSLDHPPMLCDYDTLKFRQWLQAQIAKYIETHEFKVAVPEQHDRVIWNNRLEGYKPPKHFTYPVV